MSLGVTVAVDMCSLNRRLAPEDVPRLGGNCLTARAGAPRRAPCGPSPGSSLRPRARSPGRSTSVSAPAGPRSTAAPSGSCIARPNAPELLFHRATTTPRTETSRPGTQPVTSWCTSSEPGAGEPSAAEGPSRSSQLDSASTDSAAAPPARCCHTPEREATRVPSAQRDRHTGFAPR